MTTIVWDGKTLASDRATFQGNVVVAERCKIARRTSDGALIGSCGDTCLGAALMRWFLNGENGERPGLGDDKNNAEAIIARADGSVELHFFTGWYEPAGVVALGAGKEFALGAIDAGAGAADAVRFATLRVGGNTEKIDTLDLHPQSIARLVST